VLREACQNLAVWRPTVDAVLRVRLSRLQSADDDLVAAVIRATEAGRIDAHLLEVGFDTGAVLEDYGAARDNLEVVADIGVCTALCRFDGGPRELAMLAKSSARSVVLADSFGDKDEHDEVVEKATVSLVGSLKAMGVAISVDNVRTDAEADWWNEVGVDTAQGPLFGMPTNLERILSPNGQSG